jgi:HEAT repeat protein
MPGKRAFEEQVAALDALRHGPEEARVAPLRKALGHRNNFIVAKAADLIREFVREPGLAALTPELLTAFDRFFDDPVKTDPQCWAKNAISRTLAAMEHQDEEVFLRGMRHIQMEPVWGGQSDTAGTLRATCALALVQCRSLTEKDLLEHLVELLADKDKTVRVEVVRAIEQIGSPSAVLLLRLRAVLGADEPEVLGACYSGILRIEGVRAIPWVRRFLAAADDCAAEAALAIAGTHSPEGFDALRESFVKAADPWWRSVLLSAIALTRQDAALEFLLDLVRTESLDAETAIEVVLRSMPSKDITERLKKLVAGNQRLARAFAAHKKPGS